MKSIVVLFLVMTTILVSIEAAPLDWEVDAYIDTYEPMEKRGPVVSSKRLELSLHLYLFSIFVKY